MIKKYSCFQKPYYVVEVCHVWASESAAISCQDFFENVISVVSSINIMCPIPKRRATVYIWNSYLCAQCSTRIRYIRSCSFDPDVHPVYMREGYFAPYQRHSVWLHHNPGCCPTTVIHQQCTLLDICNHVLLPKRP